MDRTDEYSITEKGQKFPVRILSRLGLEFPSSKEPQVQLHQVLLLLIAFFFPLFQKALPLCSILLGLNALVLGVRVPEQAKRNFREKERKGLLYAMILFFLLHLLGLTMTWDIGSGLYELQQKSALLLFPLLFLFMPRPSGQELAGVLHAFLTGTVVATLFGMISAFSVYWSSGNMDGTYLLYGAEFSIFMHRGYFAIYLLFGAFIAWEKMYRGSSNNGTRAVFAFIFILLVFGVLFTASRAAILILFIMAGMKSFREVRRPFHKKVGVAFLAFITLMGLLFLFPRNFQRFQDLFPESNEVVSEEKEGQGAAKDKERNKNERERSGGGNKNERILVWMTAKDLFLENFWSGVGTGNSDPALQKRYEAEGAQGPLRKELNAHSQYFQTGIALGIWGLAVLVALLYLAIKAGWERSGALLHMGIAVGIACLFESFLERQAGILFFSFFFPLLYVAFEKVAEKRIWKGGRGMGSPSPN